MKGRFDSGPGHEATKGRRMRQRITIMTGGKFSPDALKDIAGMVGGYTVTDHHGGWLDDDGTLIEEPGQTLTVFTPGGNCYPRLIFRIKDDATRRGEQVIVAERVETTWSLV